MSREKQRIRDEKKTTSKAFIFYPERISVKVSENLNCRLCSRWQRRSCLKRLPSSGFWNAKLTERREEILRYYKSDSLAAAVNTGAIRVASYMKVFFGFSCICLCAGMHVWAWWISGFLGWMVSPQWLWLLFSNMILEQSHLTHYCFFFNTFRIFSSLLQTLNQSPLLVLYHLSSSFFFFGFLVISSETFIGGVSDNEVSIQQWFKWFTSVVWCHDDGGNHLDGSDTQKQLATKRLVSAHGLWLGPLSSWKVSEWLMGQRGLR